MGKMPMPHVRNPCASPRKELVCAPAGGAKRAAGHVVSKHSGYAGVVAGWLRLYRGYAKISCIFLFCLFLVFPFHGESHELLRESCSFLSSLNLDNDGVIRA